MGYFDKMQHKESMLRELSYRIYLCFAQPPVMPITKYWPIESDKKIETETVVMSKDIFEQIKKAHNLK